MQLLMIDGELVTNLCQLNPKKGKINNYLTRFFKNMLLVDDPYIHDFIFLVCFLINNVTKYCIPC
jgi:hypothetical protein